MKKLIVLLLKAGLFAVIMIITGCQQPAEKKADDAVNYRAMAAIPAGTFNQTDGTESFINTVSGISMGKYEVTYKLWYTVYQWATTGGRGYTFANYGTEGGSEAGSAASSSLAPTSRQNEPVTFINWRDCIVWCNAYSQMTGLTPVYYTDSGFTLPLKICNNDNVITYSTEGSQDFPFVNWPANGYRLPTEGEWQYTACWKGSDSSNYAVEYPAGSGKYWTPYNYASGDILPCNSSSITGNLAWFYLNSENKSHDAGTKLPNQLGIYDMSGNVYEWCWDWYGSYPGGEMPYYKGMNLGGSSNCRLYRGGGWNLSASYLLLGLRSPNYPYRCNNYVGFRVVKKI